MKKSIFCASLLVAGLALADSTEFAVDNVLGVMPVKANGKGQVMLSIPWVEVGGGSDCISVSNLVKAASLKVVDESAGFDGDSLSWYNTRDEKFMGWRLMGGDTGTNYWHGIQDGNTGVTPAADAPMLARGQGLILERAEDTNGVVYVIGQVGTNATIRTSISASADGKTPKYTLIAPPFASGTATNANFLVFSATPDTKDRIRLEAVGGANTNTELKRKQVTENDTTVWAWVNASNGLKEQAMIPAGRGFIYIRYGTEDLSVIWDAPSINN